MVPKITTIIAAELMNSTISVGMKLSSAFLIQSGEVEDLSIVAVAFAGCSAWGATVVSPVDVASSP